jgi:hypothetical protein
MKRQFCLIGAAALLSLLIASARPAWAQAPAPGNNLSDRLGKSGGVIAPRRGIDPKIQITPPDTGPTSTPVIPPPGSPGGNPNVVPK